VGVGRFVVVGVIVRVGFEKADCVAVRPEAIPVEVGEGVEVSEDVNVRKAEIPVNASEGTIVRDGRIGLDDAPALPQLESSTKRTAAAFRPKE
jgi:hypothetical protein